MRQLTFPGFMEQYIISLSEGKRGGVYPLTREATTSNPRLREPLFLYALATRRINTLLSAAKNTSMFQVYCEMAESYTYEELIDVLLQIPVNCLMNIKKFGIVINLPVISLSEING